MATFTCNACGHSKTVGDELIGKRGRCGECGEISPITGEAASRPEPASRPASPIAPAFSSPSTPAPTDADAINYRAGAWGFKLIFWAMLLVNVIIFFNWYVESMVGRSLPQEAWYIVLGLMAIRVISIGILLRVTNDPQWRRTTWWMLGSLIVLIAFDLVTALAGVVPEVANMLVSLPEWGLVLLPFASLFFRFLVIAQQLQLAKQSGVLLHRRPLATLAKKALRIYRIWIWIVILSVVGALYAVIVPIGALFLLTLPLANLVLATIFVVYYFMVLWQVGQAYAKKCKKRRR